MWVASDLYIMKIKYTKIYMLVHKCKDKTEINLSNQSLNIKLRNPKVNLFLKPKVKANGWSQNKKKDVSKVQK